LRGDSAGIERSAKEDDEIFGLSLVHVEVNLRNAGIGQRFGASIRDHADYGGPDWLGRVQPEAPA
jgi:hypothetical protein